MESTKRNLLLDLTMVELGEKGYADSSLASVLNAAEVSADEFEDEFADREACVFAAYDRLTGEILQRVREASRVAIDWPERVRAGLSALLEEVAARPAMAAVITRTFPAIGPDAYRRYSEFLSRLAELVGEGRDYSGVGDQLPAEVELLAVGSAEALIFQEIDAGRARELPRMMPEILFSILVPFLGPERAGEEMRQATAAI